tara:strand:+ start:352 stop:552 length:201 start_codon:yes stop_codon:yes gene_type:complete
MKKAIATGLQSRSQKNIFTNWFEVNFLFLLSTVFHLEGSMRPYFSEQSPIKVWIYKISPGESTDRK